MANNYVVGVDFGGTNIRAALVSAGRDSVYEIVSRVKEPTGKDPVNTLFSLLDSLRSGNEAGISGIGLAVAGLIDKDNGAVLKSPNVPGIDGLPLRAEIEKRYGCDAVVENDANAAAYGEKCAGAGAGLADFVLLTLGTGIGAGIIIDGKLLPVAAEAGHMSIRADGETCACGNLGCLELYASATAIINSAVSMIEKGDASSLRGLYNGNLYRINAEDIYRTALEGDPLSRSVLREAGRSLGIGIANIINILSPEAVILAGGLAGAWNIYVEAAVKEASRRAWKELYRRVKIIPSSLGDDAGIVGAARLASELQR